MSDLTIYVDAWRHSADAVLALEPEDWDDVLAGDDSTYDEA